MNKENISKELKETFDHLVELIGSFDDQSFNKVPFEGSWTPGQVAQHLRLANGGFSHVLNGKVENTARTVDHNVAILKDIFLNFGHKMKSPEFILPKLEDYDRNEMMTTFNHIGSEISAATMSLDLSKTCLEFQFPNLGHLTRLEAIYFIIYHTQRHNHQLAEIRQYLKLS